MASRLRTPSKFEIREPKETIDRLARFIRTQAELARAKQLIVGMSGGLDSSVTASLCAIAVGGSKVLGLSMPEKETVKSENIEDGQKVRRRSMRYPPIRGCLQDIGQRHCQAPQSSPSHLHKDAQPRVVARTNCREGTWIWL